MSLLVIGDSIAAKLASHIPECFVSAHIGGTAEYIEARTAEWCGTSAIICVGSNDREVSRTVLGRLRAKLIVQSALWVLPFAYHNGRVVRLFAIDRKDQAVAFASSLDGMHPIDYVALSESIQRKFISGGPKIGFKRLTHVNE